MIPITKEASVALEGSVKKWKEITRIAATGSRNYSENGSHDCPLCQLYNPNEDNAVERGADFDASCAGCPINADTGKVYCKNTPYDPWLKQGETPARAKAMLDYLTGLTARCVVVDANTPVSQ